MNATFDNIFQRRKTFHSLFYEQKNKKIIDSNRFISGYSHESFRCLPYYSISSFMLQHSDVYNNFIEWGYVTDLVFYSTDSTLNSYVFVVRSEKFKKLIISYVSFEEYNLIFPKGLPQNQKDFDKWVSHIGLLAKKQHKKQIIDDIEENKTVVPDIKQLREIVKRLRSHNMDAYEIIKMSLV